MLLKINRVNHILFVTKMIQIATNKGPFCYSKNGAAASNNWACSKLYRNKIYSDDTPWPFKLPDPTDSSGSQNPAALHKHSSEVTHSC